MSKNAQRICWLFFVLLVVGFSIAVVSGCAKKSAETKPARPRSTTTPRPTTTAPDPSGVDLSKYLSPGEKLLTKLFADVNKDGNKEIIFLSGKSWDVNVQDPFLITIHILTWDGSKYVPSWEQKTEGEISQELRAEDVNKDSIVEILSKQAMGAGSVALYVVAWNGSSYDLLKPVGPVGANPKDFFGPKGAKVKDNDNDGVKEIYAHYGPAGSQADIYKWDGKNYVYSRTVSLSQ